MTTTCKVPLNSVRVGTINKAIVQPEPDKVSSIVAHLLSVMVTGACLALSNLVLMVRENLQEDNCQIRFTMSHGEEKSAGGQVSDSIEHKPRLPGQSTPGKCMACQRINWTCQLQAQAGKEHTPPPVLHNVP